MYVMCAIHNISAVDKDKSILSVCRERKIPTFAAAVAVGALQTKWDKKRMHMTPHPF